MSIPVPWMVERLATSASMMGLSLSRFSKTNLRTARSRFLSLKTGASEEDSAETNGEEDNHQTKSTRVRLRKGMLIAVVSGVRFCDDKTKSNLTKAQEFF